MPVEAARTWDVTARLVGVVLHFQQDERCTYNFNIEVPSCNHCCNGKAINITYSDCVCSLRCLACDAQAPYCLWPGRLYIIFAHNLMNDTIFEREKLLNIKCMFFTVPLLSNIYYYKKNRARYDQKCLSVFM